MYGCNACTKESAAGRPLGWELLGNRATTCGRSPHRFRSFDELPPPGCSVPAVEPNRCGGPEDREGARRKRLARLTEEHRAVHGISGGVGELPVSSEHHLGRATE